MALWWSAQLTAPIHGGIEAMKRFLTWSFKDWQADLVMAMSAGFL